MSGTVAGLPETSVGRRRADSKHQPDALSVEPPGVALGDLGHVRRDLVRILSLAGVMLLILVVAALVLA